MRWLRFPLLLALALPPLAGAAPARPDDPASLPRSTGTPFLRTWTAEDYGAAPGNRGVLQHPQNGFIYVGNNAGVLEFDGSRWNLIRVPGRPTVRTLAVDARGHVWTANDDMICRLAPGPLGVLTAFPMGDRLPSEARSFRSAFTSLATPAGVYFTSARHLLFFPTDDRDTARAWPLPEEAVPIRLWWHDDAPHWQLASRATYRLRADRVELVPGAVGAPASDGSEVLASLRLNDGRLAVAKERDGVLIRDSAGRLLRRLNRSNGLPSHRIDALGEDREGGLWLALRNGLARVQLDSPYAVHGAAQGLEGAPIALGLDRGALYVTSGEGLWRRDDQGRFQTVAPDLLGPRKLVSDAGRMFVAGANLQFAPPAQPLRVVDDRPHHGFLPLRSAPGIFVFGTPNGLSFGRADRDSWRRLGRCTGISGPVHAMLEHPAGIVWALSPAGTLWRVDFTRGARPDAPTRALAVADGLPAGASEINTRLLPLGDSLVVLSQGQLLRLDAGTSRLVPETRISGLPAPPENAPAIALAGLGADGAAWLQLPAPARTTFRVLPDGPNRWRATPLAAPPLPRYAPNELLPDSAAHTLWFAAPAALISLDLDWQPARPAPPLTACFRRLETDAGLPLWRDGRNLAAPDAAASLRLDHRQTALRVVYAAPTYPADFRGRTHLFFRTRLDGLDQAWSAWSQTAQREFTNLPYRAFTLRLQARDDTGRVSAETLLAFAIAPPWWLTGWAFAGYTALALLAGAQVVRWRTGVLRRKAAHLETVVAARTEELRVQNQELARLHELELDEKISAQLAEERARLEVLRYQLNPHFLFNSLNSICAQIAGSPAAARAMVVRLADFCRLTLHRPEATESAMTIAEEVALLRTYLEIEQARLGELLVVELSADPAAAAFRLPPFLLLPLVENAVKYGAQTSVDRLIVRLQVRREADGAIAIEVANTGTWLEPGSHSAPSHGIGLENLRQRLERYFPAAHEFATVATDGWVSMRLRLLAPLREPPRPAH